MAKVLSGNGIPHQQQLYSGNLRSSAVFVFFLYSFFLPGDVVTVRVERNINRHYFYYIVVDCT